MVKMKIEYVFLCVFAVGITLFGVLATAQATRAPYPPARPTEITIPFELVNNHIFLKVRVNNSDPLWFILDTGDDIAIVDMGVAKSLGLTLQGQINVGGAGAGTLTGAYVKDCSYSVPGIEGFAQPVVLAVPWD